jgi:hypothetical protein
VIFLPDAAALAGALAELEQLKRAFALSLEVSERLREDVARLEDIHAAESERLQMLEAMIRGRS